jgi:hypothetical protein
MNLFILSQYKLIQNLYKNNNYLDYLINVEDYFDILNLYAFPNWLDCEVVDVKCMKYFTNIVLKAPYNKMPHPKGSVLLTKFECEVKYIETYDYQVKEVKDIEDTYYNDKKGERCPKIEKNKVWIIDILIPNKHLVSDKIYDMDAMQEKIKDDEASATNMESMVDNDINDPAGNQELNLG